MNKKPEPRTELVTFRLTRSEKLRLIKAARKPKYGGSMTELVRDVLTSAINDKSATALQGTGALAKN